LQSLVVNNFHLLLPPQPPEVNRLQGLVQKGSQRVSQKAKRDQKVQRD